MMFDKDDFHLATLEEDRFCDGELFFKAILGDRAIVAYRAHDTEDRAATKPKQRWRLMIAKVNEKGEIPLIRQMEEYRGDVLDALVEFWTRLLPDLSTALCLVGTKATGFGARE